MRTTVSKLCILVLLFGALAGCNKGDESATQSNTAADSSPASRAKPDFGGVKEVTVTAEGVGETPELAVVSALDMAITQVNGRRVDSTIASMEAQVRAQGTGGQADVNASAFIQEVVSASKGAVTSFRVLEQEEIQRVEAERIVGVLLQRDRVYKTYWRAKVEANVAKYVAPDEKGRPKIAIVLPRTKSQRYAVGDNMIPAEEVASEIRLRLSDAITQTKRFIVLDREFGDVLDAEAEFIESGRARNQELARIGQQMATDLLLVVSIDRFEYPRSTRKLRMSERELISYAGGGKVSLKLINATTGEIVMSESFSHELPATPPSTLPRTINGRELTRQMMDAISGKMTASVINEIFPVSVIALDGNTVVLSQGGQSVAAGARYQAVSLGQELTDPQTGNSLGRMETPCCVIRIDRVTDQTSYGTIEGELPQLAAFQPGMIELREQLQSATVASPAAAPATESPKPKQSAAAAPRATTPTAPAEETKKSTTDGDADW